MGGKEKQQMFISRRNSPLLSLQFQKNIFTLYEIRGHGFV